METTWTAVARRWLGHRWMPAALALAAVLVMLPALGAGLGMDDLVQRVFQLNRDQVPQVIRDTGIVNESGTLRVVLSDLFGFQGGKQALAQARNYGILPWWTREGLKAALWRPLSAFTHWLDYRIFPNSPVLMHAHSIAWFAGVVFIAALLYREILQPVWVAGLASLLFLLDKNTYFPVMFVANRGFVISLFFGLLSVHAHHRWRCTKAFLPAVLSSVALAASLLSNEAGVSTLAFLIAYALFLEPDLPPGSGVTSGGVQWEWLRQGPRRLGLVLPAIAVIVAWRVVYQTLGHGVANVGAYLDPSQEPLPFLTAVLPRSAAILGGQLTGLPPELTMALRPSLDQTVVLVACGAVAVIVMALMPLLQRERVARFWFAAMLLTLIPAATVVPLSKNMGFVAVAAFGVIAMFVQSVVTRTNAIRGLPKTKWFAGTVCVVLVIAHVAGAIGGRIAAVQIAPSALGVMGRLGDVMNYWNTNDKDIVVLNAPCSLALMETPFARLYHGQELPRTLRSLAPGYIGLHIERPDACTLVVRPSGANMFECRNVGPLDFSYVCARIDQLFRTPTYKRGERVRLKGLEVQLLEVDQQGLPTAILFRFDTQLGSASFRWVYFDWRNFRFHNFEMPASGQSTYIPGPHEG